MIKINGTQIKEPHSFEVERYNLTKSGRVASGKMVMDLVAKKWKLALTYEVISASDLDAILALIDTDKMFFGVEWEDNNNLQKATMYVGAIKKTKFRSPVVRFGEWYWKSIAFDFIEQ